MLAEFLVARALHAAHRPRIEWEPYDVVTDDGLRVEVKSAAYLQAWAQSGPSTITFGGLRARTWAPRDGFAATSSYNADVYVFAVLMATEHHAYDPLDTAQWSFWVVPRSTIQATGQQSLRLSRVEALAGAPVGYAELAAWVRSAVDGREP
ncbi:hypothetical protein [Modestobacter sp. SYSU DS0290]